ncbi:MAG: hypothetical protein LBQ13_02025 [Endomicrobium sp.]|nr:hypothetical protein [Endomicrobium sp.]
MIFDEINTEKIGKNLSRLQKKQVFSTTHLEEVAAFATMHIKYYKK